MTKAKAGTVFFGPASGLVDPAKFAANNLELPTFHVTKSPSDTPKTVALVSSVTTPADQAFGNIASAISAQLGWKTKTYFGDGSPTSLATGFDQAINKGADFIVGIGAPPSLVGQQLARAKSRGVTTIAYGVPTAQAQGYTYSVPAGFPLQQQLLAAAQIASTNGSAKSLALDVDASQQPIFGLNEYKQFMALCSQCKATSRPSFPQSDYTNTPKLQQFFASLFSTKPDVQFIELQAASGLLQYVVTTPGFRGEYTITGPAGDSAELALVKAGKASMVGSFPYTMSILEIFDTALRVAAGEPGLPFDKQPGTAMLWMKGGALPPGNSKGAIEKFALSKSPVNYLDAYGKAWGVDLSGALDGLK